MSLLQLDVPFEAESPRWITVTAPAQLSEAVTRLMFGPGTCEKHWTDTEPGHVIDGGVVSTVVMIWAHVAVLPLASIAVQVRVMIGPAQVAPVVASENVTVTAPPHGSVAVAVPVTAGVVGVLQGTLASGGQVMVGGPLSTTVTSP